MIAAYLEIKDQICDHDGVGREMAKSILEPPLHDLGVEPDQSAEFPKRQPMIPQVRHMANAATRITGNIVDGPETGLEGDSYLRSSRFL